MFMCGISGIVNYDQPVISKDAIQRMNSVLKHRGPDDNGVYFSDFVGFGHVRLSIIDVAGSIQPLCNEDKSIWIIFNGEIYNYKELKKPLEAGGHQFRTQGDTEVLLHLYEEHGTGMLKYLNGMFAFAIWDQKKKKLFAARDRMGIKPVYYCQNGGLVFSSEPKAILQVPGIVTELNENALWDYFTYRAVPAPETLFQGIKKLPQGHYLEYTTSGLSIHQYWDIPINAGRILDNKSAQQIITEVDDLLLTSVNRRMISDVPIGAFLSGGVDSSLIVAIMSRLSQIPVKTYSVGFEHFDSSETPYANIVANQYKTDHHELIMREADFDLSMEKMIWFRDAPLSEPADIPLYYLSRMASAQVKVLLSGEGSDELFGGYPKYAFDRFHTIFNFFPNSLLQHAIDRLPERFRRLEIALKCLSEQDTGMRWARWFAPFSKDDIGKLSGRRMHAKINPTQQMIAMKGLNHSLAEMLYIDCKIWLADNLLDRGDRMTMGASIEGRVPFLDHELVEYAFQLPERYKVRRMTRKWLVKKIAQKYLPGKIVNRPKAGFVVPLAEWFRGKLKEKCYDALLDRNSITTIIFSRKQVEKILKIHCSRQKDLSLQIWTLLGLAIWYKVFFRKSDFGHEGVLNR